MSEDGIDWEKRRKEFISKTIEDLINDDKRIEQLSNQLFGGIEAMTSVYNAIHIHGVDREILREHINKMLDYKSEEEVKE